MNQEKKYRRSHLLDLSESVSAKSLSIRLSLCSVCLYSPFLPRNCFPFISRDPGPLMAQKIRVFNAHIWKRGLRYASAYPRPLESANLVRFSVGPPRCCEALCRNVECLVAAYPKLHCTSHCFLCFGFFFYYLASFLIPISTCPKKHYSMGD